MDIAIPNTHNFHSAITEKLQKYTDLKAELIGLWELKTAIIIPLVLSTTGIIPQKLHESLKLLNLRTGPPLWSSGQSFWLQIQRSRVRFPALPDFSE